MSATESQLSSTYVATLDAGVEDAYDAFRAIDPVSSLAARLCALGIGEREIWVEPSGVSGLIDTHDGGDLGFGLLWRFERAGHTARIGWRVRLGEDGEGRTVLSITMRVRPSDDEARKRRSRAGPSSRRSRSSTRRACDAPSRTMQPILAKPSDARRRQC
jgi:hypothetical protein